MTKPRRWAPIRGSATPSKTSTVPNKTFNMQLRGSIPNHFAQLDDSGFTTLMPTWKSTLRFDTTFESNAPQDLFY